MPSAASMSGPAGPAAGAPTLLALCTVVGFNIVVFYIVAGAVRGIETYCRDWCRRRRGAAAYRETPERPLLAEPTNDASTEFDVTFGWPRQTLRAVRI